MKNILIIFLLVVLVQCEPVVPQSSSENKKIVFDNYSYEDFVGLAQIVPIDNGTIKELEPPIVSLKKLDQLILSFDLLTDQFENLSAKIYHCNKDWEKSGLREMEFLDEINNYRVTEFDYSVNTKQPYISYNFLVPKPKISGNFILAIFRRSNPDDLILTRRFMVIDNKVRIDHLVKVSNTVAVRDNNQQIEYSISYQNLLVNNPIQDLSTILLQNHNWNSAIRNISPTLLRTNEGYIEYRHPDLTTNFKGWNEFRFADLRTLNVAGRNVSKLTKTDDAIIAQLNMDRSRRGLPYTQNLQDINGAFIVQNNDAGEIPLNTDYANVRFAIKSEKIEGDVYVTGRFNNWQLTDENRMRFNSSNGIERYETTIRLKQGYYEYAYYVKSNQLDEDYFEGSHLLTENEYEILVYYRMPGNINDELIGYKRFRSVER